MRLLSSTFLLYSLSVTRRHFLHFTVTEASQSPQRVTSVLQLIQLSCAAPVPSALSARAGLTGLTVKSSRCFQFFEMKRARQTHRHSKSTTQNTLTKHGTRITVWHNLGRYIVAVHMYIAIAHLACCEIYPNCFIGHTSECFIYACFTSVHLRLFEAISTQITPTFPSYIEEILSITITPSLHTIQ